MADPTPEQRVAEATSISDRSHMSGVTVDDTVECDSCGEQFPHWARWLGHREQARANAALDAVRDALASDDPAVVRAMAERVELLRPAPRRVGHVARESAPTHPRDPMAGGVQCLTGPPTAPDAAYPSRTGSR